MSDSIKKNLTKLELDILLHLAMNPERNAQQIQRGIGYEDRNYPSVNNAVKRLRRQGFLKSEKGESQKKLPVDLYSLSSFGLGFIMAEGDENTLLDVVRKNEKEFPEYEDYDVIIRNVKSSTAIKLLRLAGKAILQYGTKAWLPQTIMIATTCSIGVFSPQELKQLGIAAKKAQSSRVMLQKAAKDFYDFAFSKNGE